MNENIELRDERGNVYVVHNQQQLNALVEGRMIRRKFQRSVGQRYRFVGPNAYNTVGRLWLVVGNSTTNEIFLVCVDTHSPDFGLVYNNNPTKVEDIRSINEDAWRMITGRTPEHFELDI